MLNKREFMAAGAATLLPSRLLASSPAHDFVLLTGLDNSNSQYKSRRILSMFTSLEEVLAEPEMLDLLTCGATGRTLFGIYLWGEKARWLAPPITISNAEPMSGMRHILKPLKAMRIAVQAVLQPPAWGANYARIGDGGTNVEDAMEFGITSLLNADAKVKVLNMVTDDDAARDGSEAGIIALRQRAEAANITINGLILGQPDALNHYFHRCVKTGPRAFLHSIEKEADMKPGWRKKFGGDVATASSHLRPA